MTKPGAVLLLPFYADLMPSTARSLAQDAQSHWSDEVVIEKAQKQ